MRPRHLLAFFLWCCASSVPASGPIYTPYTFTTWAGYDSQAGIEDGPHANARFSSIRGLAIDRSGNIYIVDTGNNTIRKISTSGTVTTVAGLAWETGYGDGTGSEARFHSPDGLAVDANGNIYVADSQNSVIRRITSAGVVTTFAGNGPPGTGTLEAPGALTIDTEGNLYVIDGADQFCCPCVPDQPANQKIRKISPSGVISTVATGFHSSGSGIVVDRDGNVWIGEHSYTVQCDKTVSGAISKITPAGVRTKLPLPSGYAGPAGLATDGQGSIYIADTAKEVIYKRDASGTLTIFAGSGQVGNVDGIGTAASFVLPSAIAVSPAGEIVVGDFGAIRRITASGQVSTYAGYNQPGIPRRARDGFGNDAIIDYAQAIAADHRGYVYFADGQALRKISPNRVVTTIPDTAVTGLAIDGADNVYIIGNGTTIRKLTPGGVLTTFVDTHYGLGAIAASADGTLYLTGTNAFLKVTPDGLVTKLFDWFSGPTRFAMGSDQRICAGSNGYLSWTSLTGEQRDPIVGLYDSCPGTEGWWRDGPGPTACLNPPGSWATFYPVAVDPFGNIFVAEDYTIRRVAGGFVSTLAGTIPPRSAWMDIRVSLDGTGPLARFTSPNGIAADAGGNVYVADGGTIRVGRLAIADTATIDKSSAPAGAARQLGVAPQTASAFKWEVIRRPVDSSNPLSSTSTANPTFIPDAVGLFIFRLTATSSTGSSITIVNFDATAGTAIASSSPNLPHGLPLTLTATVFGLDPTGTVQFFCDGVKLGSPVPLAGRTAVYRTSTLWEGTHSLTAVYSGDGTNASTTSAPVTQVISSASAIPTLSDLILLLLAATVGVIALRRLS